jgi:hypothetical protein
MKEKRFKGYACWINEGDADVPESGFYALDKHGRELAQPLRRLVAVQLADSDEHYYRDAADDEHSPPVGNVIELEAETVGEATMEVP